MVILFWLVVSFVAVPSTTMDMSSPTIFEGTSRWLDWPLGHTAHHPLPPLLYSFSLYHMYLVVVQVQALQLGCSLGQETMFHFVSPLEAWWPKIYKITIRICISEFWPHCHTFLTLDSELCSTLSNFTQVLNKYMLQGITLWWTIFLYRAKSRNV